MKPGQFQKINLLKQIHMICDGRMQGAKKNKGRNNNKKNLLV